MTDSAAGRAVFRADQDHRAVQVFLLLAWVGVLSGFGFNSYQQLTTHGIGYFSWIVHVHAVIFVGWMVLFTAQVLLIRKRQPRLHRRLGFAMLGWMGLMAVIGPATAIMRAHGRFTPGGDPPIGFAVQFTDILAFTSLTIAGALLRSRPAAHKRLMLLALFYVTDAGWSRLVNPLLAMLQPPDLLGGLAPAVTQLYGGTILLILALGAYDLARYRRLHPAWIAGTLWIFAIQALAVILLLSPGWAELTLRIIGQ
jgi:uncharacterized membrane protein